MSLGGPQFRFLPVFFGIERTNGLKFHVTAALTPGKVSCLLPPPPSQGDAASPPLHTFSPPRAEESIYLSMLEHAASPGECSNVGQLFYLALPAAQHCANHTCTICFSTSANQIALPSLQSCRETTSLGETCSPYPSANRPRVGLLLLAAPAESHTSETHQ